MQVGDTVKIKRHITTRANQKATVIGLGRDGYIQLSPSPYETVILHTSDVRRVSA